MGTKFKTIDYFKMSLELHGQSLPPSTHLRRLEIIYRLELRPMLYPPGHFW